MTKPQINTPGKDPKVIGSDEMMEKEKAIDF